MKRLLFILLALAASVAVPFVVVHSAPSPGQIRSRPAEGREPEFRPPTIREYKPKSMLVTPQHPVPRAKYPVIDIHSHQPMPISEAEFARVVKGMEDNNLQVLVNLSGSWGERLRQGLAALKTTKYKDRMVLFANVNFRDVGPGFGARAAKELEDDIKAGAMGLKVFKDLGMFDRKTDGNRLRVDDPELDPIWETCARLNVPVLIHVAEPAAFFEPLDYTNERWLELSLYPDRRHQDGVRFETLMTERNNMVKKHPNTKYILAHFGWHANDLARAGKLLDENPNVYYDVAAVLYDFGRQPRAAHDFFIKYQDRILFGKDSYQPDEYPYYWRVFETNDEYFDYYRDYHAFWKLYGIGLPDQVLRKLYYQNADTPCLTPRCLTPGFGSAFAADLDTMASFLVTGGAGFIGSHLTEELVRRGHSVRVVDSLITGKRRNLDHVPGVDFLEGDLADMNVARRAVEGMQYVLHQAAIPSVPRSVKDPVTSNRANIDASLNILVAARDAGVKRLVYAGSSSAYGNTPTLPKREDMRPNPLSPYALQKLVAEQYCQMFTQLYGFETVTIRYFNVFGPRQDPGSPYSGVISLFSTALLEGRQPIIYGDGEQTRDFTYVANVVDGVLRACDAPNAAGEVINVACGTRISLNDLLRVMNGILKTNLTPIYKEARAGDVKDSQADITKAKTLLGYTPLVSIEEGLKRTIDWCRTESATATSS